MFLKSRIICTSFNHGIIKRKYKVFPSKYTIEDYFKGDKSENFSSDELIEATMMNDESKNE